MKKNDMFFDKIQLIYSVLSKKDIDKFAKLFYIDKKKVKFENRRNYIYTNWIKRKIEPRLFKNEYSDYPFSKLNIVRDIDDFLTMDTKEFERRVIKYNQSQIEDNTNKNIKYKYLYIYNNTIDFFEIKYTEYLSLDSIKIEVIPPQNEILATSINPYNGLARYINGKTMLSFENNDFDYISAIFNTDLINGHTAYITGVAIGISNINQMIPVAKKVVLSKDKIEDLDELYLTINETEMLSAKENSFNLKHDNFDFTSSHFEKYINKINNINIFFQNLSKRNYLTSFYDNLAFKEFSAIDSIFKKFGKNQSFYVHFRRRILQILIESYQIKKYSKLYLIMPIYKNDNIFEEQTKDAIKLQDNLIEISKSVDIEIIFVLKSCKIDFKEEFVTFLEKVNSLIKISFIRKDRVYDDVESLDFCFTDNSDFVVSKTLRGNTTAFQLYKHENSIDEYHAMFRIILNRSVSYSEFIKDRDKICIKENSLLSTITGEWFHYIHGTNRFYEDKIKIFKSGNVEYYSDGKQTDKGVIISKKYQSVILLDDILNKRLFTIIFDNQLYKIQNAFISRCIVKQLEKDLDIFSTGIFSREAIEINKAKEILGNINDIRVIEDNKITDRLASYLTDY